MARNYNFGNTGKSFKVTAAAAPGTSAKIWNGRWLITVDTATVYAKRNASTVASGDGTPLAAGTTWLEIDVTSPDGYETWAFYSAGGTGVIWFTQVSV
jgi:hypothetical protein